MNSPPPQEQAEQHAERSCETLDEGDVSGRSAYAFAWRSLIDAGRHETAGHGDCVYLGRSQVGVIASGTRLPILRRNIALCRMAIEYSEIGTKVGAGKLDGDR